MKKSNETMKLVVSKMEKSLLELISEKDKSVNKRDIYRLDKSIKELESLISSSKQLFFI